MRAPAFRRCCRIAAPGPGLRKGPFPSRATPAGVRAAGPDPARHAQTLRPDHGPSSPAAASGSAGMPFQPACRRRSEPCPKAAPLDASPSRCGGRHRDGAPAPRPGRDAGATVHPRPCRIMRTAGNAPETIRPPVARQRRVILAPTTRHRQAPLLHDGAPVPLPRRAADRPARGDDRHRPAAPHRRPDGRAGQTGSSSNPVRAPTPAKAM